MNFISPFRYSQGFFFVFAFASLFWHNSYGESQSFLIMESSIFNLSFSLEILLSSSQIFFSFQDNCIFINAFQHISYISLLIYVQLLAFLYFSLNIFCFLTFDSLSVLLGWICYWTLNNDRIILFSKISQFQSFHCILFYTFHFLAMFSFLSPFFKTIAEWRHISHGA